MCFHDFATALSPSIVRVIFLFVFQSLGLPLPLRLRPLAEVLGEDPFGNRGHSLVETVVPGLVAADDENGGAFSIVGVEDPQRRGPAVRPQLAEPRSSTL